MNRTRGQQVSCLLYVSVLALWGTIVVLTLGKLLGPVVEARGILGRSFAVVFMTWLVLMWLVGLWHLMNVLFSWIASRRQRHESGDRPESPERTPAAAILYTTCNDFDAAAFTTCLRQSYDNYEVLLCDDGDDREHIRRAVDDILVTLEDRPPVTIVRRSNRQGFKAGNMNNALGIHGDRFEYFAVADADEILPPDFLSVCISRLSRRPDVGFAQCAHAARRAEATEFAARHSIAIAGHWRHFVPARERYGLMPFYGHGAVIRTEAWRRTGGFPEIVSEDFALTIQLRRAGYRGMYVPEVVCEEGFPPDFHAISRRTGKWVRGTMEFLRAYSVLLFRSSRIARVEKLDVVFCALGLLLPLPFLVILLLLAGIYLTNQHEALKVALAALWDDPLVFTTGVLAMVAPTAYIVAELPRHRLRVIKQLVFSTCTYLALVPHSAWETLGFLLTGRASFPVTGSSRQGQRGRITPKRITLLIVASFALVASAAVGDLLLMGVAVAFLFGVIHLGGQRFQRLACCTPCVLVLVGIILKPLSLLAAPLATGTSFAAHQ